MIAKIYDQTYQLHSVLKVETIVASFLPICDRTDTARIVFLFNQQLLKIYVEKYL